MSKVMYRIFLNEKSNYKLVEIVCNVFKKNRGRDRDRNNDRDRDKIFKESKMLIGLDYV